MPTIPRGKSANQKSSKRPHEPGRRDDRSHDVVKSGFLAAGAAASTIVTLALIGTTSAAATTVAVAIGTVGAVFAVALLVAAIYVARRQ